MTFEIPLFKIYNDEKDISYITKEIKSGKNWAVGSKVKEFEDKIAKYIGTKYAVVLNSGTSALHSILLAYGIGEGDEVIVPSFTFIATSNAAKFVGAKPIFADIEEETMGLDPKDVEKKITKKTKAILPIHFGGCPCKIMELREIADKHDLILIEDAAEAMGAYVGKNKIGTIGDAAILSFCQNKIITTGEGGAVVTDSDEIYQKLLLIRSHGRLEGGNYFDPESLFDYIDLGYNFRMSNLTAALGLSQIEKIEKNIAKRVENSNYLTKLLEEKTKIKTIKTPENYKNVYQLYSCIAEDRDELLNYLNKNNISAKVYFDPVHESKYYKDKLNYDVHLPISEAISKKIITLPMFPELKKEEIEYIAETIANFYNKNK